MTVSSTTNRKTFAGDAVTTSFGTSPVVFFDTSDLVVKAVTTATGAEETLVENTDYTVSGGAGATGTVSTTGGTSPYGAPAVGVTLVILRVLPLTQTDDFVNNDPSDAEVIEDRFDRLTMVLQQLDEVDSRSVKLAEGETGTDALTLLPTDRASKFLAFDASKNPIASSGTPGTVPVSAFMETVLDDTTAAAARTTLGALGTAELAAGLEKTIPECGRLTLTSSTPVTSSDVTGATTVYFTPYKGNVIALYDDDTWIPTIFSELSQTTADTTKSPAAVANNSAYDIFVWNDSGTIRATRGPAWASVTPGSASRGTGAGTTELELLEGRYVNKVAITNGPAAQRGLYVGTIKSDGSAQINDSQSVRNVWNNYNRVARSVKVTNSTDTWSYTTNTWRQANGAAANLIEYVCGLVEDAVSLSASACASNSAGGVDVATGIGLNSSSALAADCLSSYLSAPTTIDHMSAHYRGLPAIGRNQFVWLEISSATGTTTWFGDGGVPNNMRNGLVGEVRA